ncbi:MAG: helix-turn-helix domain-containing protein [Candidatus Micrarchaeota archaeon]|nr:helix-turn-helix domain-containing protein [Candidatus Micrarchaeota archaeon]
MLLVAGSKQKAELVEHRGASDIDAELAQLCRMMRIMSERDIDGTLPQVLKVMMVKGRSKPVGGSELSELSGINRITIIHHLKRLEGAGLVRRQEGKYILTVHSAEDMLMEFRKEMERHFEQMDEIAREIDAHFAAIEREFERRQSARKMRRM